MNFVKPDGTFVLERIHREGPALTSTFSVVLCAQLPRPCRASGSCRAPILKAQGQARIQSVQRAGTGQQSVL